MKNKLTWCSKCKENSVVTKIYAKGNKRVEFCINKGCGYRLALPFTQTGGLEPMVFIEEAAEITPKQWEQLQFNFKESNEKI